MKFRLALGLCLLLVPCGWTQDVREAGLWRDTLTVAADTLHLSRRFVLPGTVAVWRLEPAAASPLPSAAFRLDAQRGRLWFTPPLPPGTRVVVAYRTLPFAFQEVYQRRNVTAGVDTAGQPQAVVQEQARSPTRSSDPFGNSTLQRSGSITRGILAGNNRDVTVESGLRMQLSGEVVEGVKVQAVLTDENTPILPEGTTQRLNEFDRVFIEIATRHGTAQLGDFDLLFRESEFARFSRKLQGITVFGDLPDVRSPVFAGGKAAVAGATARGLFRVQDFAPLDGVQGPYRLEGAQGERFIIVIPGSEAVYLDGQRLTRGETEDYVIDYATGEVTFSARRLITADRRLSVEFQYTTNQFTRTLVGARTDAGFWQRPDGSARARLGVAFLREADSRQFNEEFGLTTVDSLALVAVGDREAVRSGAEPVVFNAEAPYVQYVQEVRGADTVFVAVQQAPAEGTPVFRVRFTRFGVGQGRYVRSGQSVNGIVYEYRGPGQGEYEPVRLLPKPKQQRLFDLHGAVSPVKQVELFGEWAQSVHDQNRLSSVDAADDAGDAFLAGFRLQPVRTGLGQVSAEVRRRFTSRDFAAFDRTRPVEFARRWNLSVPAVSATGGLGADETTDEAFVQVAPTPQSRLRSEYGRLDLGPLFRGTRQALVLQSAEPRWVLLDYQLEALESRDTLRQEAGTWLRQRGSLARTLGRLTPRVEVEHERRRQRVMGTDSLLAPSLAFVEVRPGLAWAAPDSSKRTLTAAMELEYRAEEQVLDGALRDAATAWTGQARLTYRTPKTFATDATLGYRVRRFTPPFRLRQQAEDTESLVLLWTGDLRPWARAVEVNTFYEAQTERTPVQQELYLRTGPELGEYVWVDDNGDGVIQVDEFIPERVPDEGLYVRTFIPSDTLQSVISVQARVRLGLDPSRYWRKPATRLQRWLAEVTTRTTLEVAEKSREADLKQVYLLNLRRFRSPETTLNGRLRLAQDVSLWRRNPRFGLDLAFSQVRALAELAAGEETRRLTTWRAEGRYRPAPRWHLKLTGTQEQNRVTSDAFASRRYDIRSRSLEPEVAWQPNPSVRLASSLVGAWKVDRTGDRRAVVLRLPVEGRYALARKMSLTGRFEAARVRLTGEAVGLAQYELTDGRGPGTSYLWNLGSQYELTRYLRATLAYDGRAPQDAPVLHTVRLQLSAVF
jgi:hypothetical protein